MRLTKLEKELLARCAELVLAGEWPWDEEHTKANERKWIRETNALRDAVTKLNGGKPQKPGGTT